MGKLLTEEAGNAVEIDEDRRAGQAHVSVGTRLCPPAKSFASPSPPASRRGLRPACPGARSRTRFAAPTEGKPSAKEEAHRRRSRLNCPGTPARSFNGEVRTLRIVTRRWGFGGILLCSILFALSPGQLMVQTPHAIISDLSHYSQVFGEER